jgi:hypothetical protein
LIYPRLNTSWSARLTWHIPNQSQNQTAVVSLADHISYHLILLIREFVQKLRGLYAAFVHCAKPHAAPCGFCFPINDVFDPCVDAVECFGSCQLFIRHRAGGASVGNGLFFFGSITAIAAQWLGRSQIMRSNDAHHGW